MIRRYDGPERRLRQRRADDGTAGAQRDANELLVLRTFRAEDDAESARDGLEVAEESGHAKDEFLAMLGHELRNPLAPIVTALEVMKLRGDPRTREHEIIERHLTYVIRLVDDLLDVSRVTRGKVELQRAPVELAAIVAVAIEMTGPLVERQQHRLHLDVPAEGLLLDADPARMAQVVSNLLTNAARYTPPGGDITLTATRAQETIELIVSDTGIGIEPNMLGRIFELFVQARPSVERNEGGLGLGLALVRNLVALHGGTVEARSDGPGRGTQMVVRLPALATARVVEQAVIEKAVLEHRTARRILLVDDNEDAAELLAYVLSMKGHEVFVAHDGPGALSLLATTQVDVGILDIGLPGMDGYELAGRIWATPGRARLRLIALTGFGQDTDRERSNRAGFDAHLVKPVSVKDVIAALSDAPAPIAALEVLPEVVVGDGVDPVTAP